MIVVLVVAGVLSVLGGFVSLAMPFGIYVAAACVAAALVFWSFAAIIELLRDILKAVRPLQ